MFMTTIPDDLTTFLNEQRDVREYRRGLAVKLALQGYTCNTISDILDVSPGFVSQAKTAYEAQGVDGLLLKYKGSQPYLSDTQRQAVIAWLKQQEEWSVEHLRDHIQAVYGVVFQSRQSYYQLLADANMSHKKAQSANPRHNPELVAAKKKRSANS
jgi:putative transposase